MAPTQNEPLITMSTRPRKCAGIQLVDRGVDSRVLSTDPGAGQEAACEIQAGLVRMREDGRDGVKRKRDEEKLLAANRSVS